MYQKSEQQRNENVTLFSLSLSHSIGVSSQILNVLSFSFLSLCNLISPVAQFNQINNDLGW